MKATLEFTLPEDAASHQLAVAAPELYGALCELARHVRSRLKHGELDDAAHTELARVRELIPHELIDRLAG